MLLNYTALAGGKVPVAAAIVSTEGAIAATISVLTGESLPGPMFVLLAIVAIGIFLAALEPGSGRAADPGGSDAPTLRLGDRRAIRAPYVLFAVAAALVFGVALFAAGRASGDVPPSWVVAAGRVAGVALVTLPLAASRRLPLTRAALPFVVIAGAGEVAGVYAFAWGARESIAITAVLASLSAILAGLIASALGDHISRRQWVGVAVVGAGVTAITLTRL
jgi:drug/metabolite transporter (DMT)-like permease